jgi:hypothetical protein
MVTAPGKPVTFWIGGGETHDWAIEVKMLRLMGTTAS